MAERGVQYGDHVQSVSVEIYGMDEPVTIWVVVGRTGLVLSVAEPPVGCVVPVGPRGVYFKRETP